MTTQNHQSCIITNMSRDGVLIALNKPMPVGKDCFLRCGPVDHFMTVTRKSRGLNALLFDIPVSDDFVLQMRKFQDSFAARELEDLRDAARRWTDGNSGNRW